MTVTLKVTDREGQVHELAAEQGLSLMHVLRDAQLGIEGTCGGGCSCGSCHVYVSASLAAHIQHSEADEQDMLEAMADVVEVKPASRLSCQITISGDMDGAELAIAPQF